MGADYKKADKHVLQFGTSSTIAGGQTRYVGICQLNANEIVIDFCIPWHATALRLVCKSSAPPGVGETFDYMLRHNRGNTALVVQIAGAVDMEGNDVANAEAYAEFDQICVRVIASAGAAACQHYITVGFIA